MLRTPSWKWLTSRLTARAFAPDPKTPSRPCLPAIEQLDDRVLLTVSTDAEVVPPPNGENQILIGLLRGQLELVSHELNVLKIAGDLKLDIHKFNESFLKIDDVITKFGEGQMKGEVDGVKLDRAVNDLKIEFLKIDGLVGGLPDESELKAVLEGDLKIFETTSINFLKFLGASTGGGDLEHKVEDSLLKVADSFLKLDGAILKVEEDSIARKAGKGQQEYLQIKLQDVLVSSLKVDDPELKIELADLEKQTAGLLGGGDNTDGVTVETTDDVLA